MERVRRYVSNVMSHNLITSLGIRSRIIHKIAVRWLRGGMAKRQLVPFSPTLITVSLGLFMISVKNFEAYPILRGGRTSLTFALNCDLSIDIPLLIARRTVHDHMGMSC